MTDWITNTEGNWRFRKVVVPIATEMKARYLPESVPHDIPPVKKETQIDLQYLGNVWPSVDEVLDGLIEVRRYFGYAPDDWINLIIRWPKAGDYIFGTRVA